MAKRRMTYREIKLGERVRLTRGTTRYTDGLWIDGGGSRTYQAGAEGVVTMKGHEWATGLDHGIVRVRFDGFPGEPWFGFPTSQLEFAE